MKLTAWPPKRKWMVAALFFLWAASLNGIGQEPLPDLSEASLEQLGNIKVYSASRHLQAAGDAPSSVSVITADDIQQHGYRTLADILQTVRGFFVTYDRNYSSVGVRGYARPGDFNTRILLLVDGHRLNDNLYDEAMIGTEFPIDIDLIDRIEVIRGPVSSLYGSNAFFAVVDIITKRAEDLNGLEVSSSAGSFNTYEGRISYGRKLSKLEFLISSTFYGSRGHNRLFFPEYNAAASNYGLASHADDDQVGSSLATISFGDFTLQSVFGTREKGVPTAPYGTVFNDPRTRTTDAHSYVDLRYEHLFPHAWNLVARTFYDRYTYQGTYIYASPLDPANPTLNLDSADGKWWGVELQLSKTLFRRHRLTVGGECRDNLRQDQSNYDLAPYALLFEDKRTSFVGASYLQDELTLTRSLTLNAGFRFDYYSATNASADPRAALIYRPRSHTAFKAIYGEAFRVPNVYEKYYLSPPDFPNPALRPEKIRTAEFVWEQGIRNYLWFSTSAFHNWIDGLITEQPLTHDSLIFRNLAEAESTGFEAEVKFQLQHALEGTASYSFQRTEASDAQNFSSDSPRNLIKFDLTQPLFRRRMFASLNGQYRGRMESFESGSVSPSTVFSFTLLGHNLGDHFDMSASIYNLLGHRYWDPPSIGNLQQPIQQDGRSFRIKITWHMGER